MPTPSYNDFIQNVQPDDIRALVLLTNGNVIKTTDAVEAASIKARLDRLFTYNMIAKPKEGWDKVIDGVPPNEVETLWYLFEARVTPTALNYLGQACADHATYLQSQP